MPVAGTCIVQHEPQVSVAFLPRLKLFLCPMYTHTQRFLTLLYRSVRSIPVYGVTLFVLWYDLIKSYGKNVITRGQWKQRIFRLDVVKKIEVFLTFLHVMFDRMCRLFSIHFTSIENCNEIFKQFCGPSVYHKRVLLFARTSDTFVLISNVFWMSWNIRNLFWIFCGM